MSAAGVGPGLDGEGLHEIELTVNGQSRRARVPARRSLADFLREDLDLTGTRLGCEHGVCGACTVLLDGGPARGCLGLAVACDGRSVTTIEGFDDDPVMEALRAAFSAHHALQCGYCTSGMLITARDVVRRLPGASPARVREELAGNLCRCTGYAGIVDAVVDVASRQADAPGFTGEVLPLRRGRRASVDSRQGDARETATGTGAFGRERRARVAVPADVLWQTLQDVETVVRCLPGAELVGRPDESPLRLRLTASIGPMRATFDGKAELHYDEEARRGTLRGSSVDRLTRSTAEGSIGFAVVSLEAQTSELVVDVQHVLKGVLAQFGRGAVVDAVIDGMLGRFAGELGRAAAGESLEAAPIAPRRSWLASWLATLARALRGRRD